MAERREPSRGFTSARVAALVVIGLLALGLAYLARATALTWKYPMARRPAT